MPIGETGRSPEDEKLNREEAAIVAYTEKPFLDAVEEDGATPEEKAVLEKYATIRSRKAVEDFRKKKADLEEQVARGERSEEEAEKVLTVNYDRPIDEGVAAGHYDFVHHREYFTEERFPLGDGEHGEKKKKCKLFRFDRGITTEEVVQAMAAEGYKPAVLQELLTYGENDPEAQRPAPIIALNTEWDHPTGGLRTVALDAERDKGDKIGKRGLQNYQTPKRWDGYSQFLGIADEALEIIETIK